MTHPTQSAQRRRPAHSTLPFGLKDALPLELVGADPMVAARRREANTMIVVGLGIGVFGAASLALVGTTCPLCVVVAPALVGLGVVQSFRARRG